MSQARYTGATAPTNNSSGVGRPEQKSLATPKQDVIIRRHVSNLSVQSQTSQQKSSTNLLESNPGPSSPSLPNDLPPTLLHRPSAAESQSTQQQLLPQKPGSQNLYSVLDNASTVAQSHVSPTDGQYIKDDDQNDIIQQTKVPESVTVQQQSQSQSQTKTIIYNNDNDNRLNSQTQSGCPFSNKTQTQTNSGNEIIGGIGGGRTDAGGCPMGRPDDNAPKGEYYHTYLGLDKILSAQVPVSGTGHLPEDMQRINSSSNSGSSSSITVSNSNQNLNVQYLPEKDISLCVNGTTTEILNKNDIGTESQTESKQNVNDIKKQMENIPLKMRKEPAHDEMFFIITHQTYELWFKQILHELDSIHAIFYKGYIEDAEVELVCHRLHRITKIQEVLVSQISVLETMTPMEFLDFRDYLAPASGFQSWQFRVIELTLGLPIEGRRYGSESFLMGVLYGEQREKIQKLRDSDIPSLNKLIEEWLERIPFGSYDFWKEYQQAVDDMIQKDEDIIKQLVPLDRQEEELKSLKAVRSNFASLLDEKIYKEMLKRKVRKWSQKATLAALFIFLYRNEPMLAGPFRLLNLLMEIDENFGTWRLRHAAMAHRMIGMKIGTGGTSGVEYLNKAATENKAFKDLWQLSTYLLPSSALPKLPPELKMTLQFHYDVQRRSNCGTPLDTDTI